MAKNGIDFIINGKDKASSAMQSVAKSLNRLQAAFVAYQGIVFSKASFDKVNQAYDQQTASVKKLTNALAIRGQSAASGQMQAMAKDLEKLTGVSDQSTMALMQQAQSIGFATDRMDDAAKAALGLAEATGKTAEQSLGDMKAALEGNFEAFHGLNPQIMYMRTNQEKLAAVMAIANQGLDTLSQNSTTVAGSGQRANTALGSLMETVGAIIAPVRVLINAGLQQLAESLQSVLAPAAAYAQQVLQNIGPIMDWVKEKVIQGVNLIIGAFTFLETILTNLSDVWEIVKAAAELAMNYVAQEVMHVLTVVIPAYANWFLENFPNFFKDAFNLAFTFTKNRLQQIADAIAELWVFIESGGQTDIVRNLGEIAGRNLVEGFESSLTALPDIAERKITQREQDLADKIGKIGGRLGQEFSDKMSERMVGVGSTLNDEMSAAAKQIDLQGRAAVKMQGNQATEGRLLSRGPGTQIPSKLDEIINLLKNPPGKKKEEKDRNDTLAAINEMKRRREAEVKLEFVQ